MGRRRMPLSPKPLAELVSPDWAEALRPVADGIAGMGDFLRAEYHNIRADTEGKRENGGESEAGGMAELAEGEIYVGEEAFGAWPHPGFVAGFFDTGYIAELAAARILRVSPAHALGHQSFNFFCQALKKMSQPTHDGPFTTRKRQAQDECR